MEFEGVSNLALRFFTIGSGKPLLITAGIKEKTTRIRNSIFKNQWELKSTDRLLNFKVENKVPLNPYLDVLKDGPRSSKLKSRDNVADQLALPLTPKLIATSWNYCKHYFRYLYLITFIIVNSPQYLISLTIMAVSSICKETGTWNNFNGLKISRTIHWYTTRIVCQVYRSHLNAPICISFFAIADLS